MSIMDIVEVVVEAVVVPDDGVSAESTGTLRVLAAISISSSEIVVRVVDSAAL